MKHYKSLFEETKVELKEAVSPKDYVLLEGDDETEALDNLAKALKKFNLFVYESPTMLDGGGFVGYYISKKSLTKKDLEELDNITFPYSPAELR